LSAETSCSPKTSWLHPSPDAPVGNAELAMVCSSDIQVLKDGPGSYLPVPLGLSFWKGKIWDQAKLYPHACQIHTLGFHICRLHVQRFNPPTSDQKYVEKICICIEHYTLLTVHTP
jgi:hypothetical protein